MNELQSQIIYNLRLHSGISTFTYDFKGGIHMELTRV